MSALTPPIWFWLLLCSFSIAFGWMIGHSIGYRKGFNDARWIISRKY